VSGGGIMPGHNEISKQYEKFVLDVVNAKTSDEIFLRVLTNIAEIFNFSNEFKKDIRGMYPSRKKFLSLPSSLSDLPFASSGSMSEAFVF
jgi:hypothetical protein